MSPKRKAKWINGEKMIITDVIFRWVQLIQKQCWENIHIHIIAGETIQRRPASFSGVRLMNEPTHWPRQTPREHAMPIHPSIHPPHCHPEPSISFSFYPMKNWRGGASKYAKHILKGSQDLFAGGYRLFTQAAAWKPDGFFIKADQPDLYLIFFYAYKYKHTFGFHPPKKAAWRNKLSPLLILMEYGFTGICDECVVKSSTGRTLDYIWLKEFGGKVEWHH